MLISSFTTVDITLISLVFLWTGFVRTGIGFGGAALGLPLLLFIKPEPLLWLPIIGIHLLFFSSINLRITLPLVDWKQLNPSLGWIMPTTVLGLFGLLSMPSSVVVIFIYTLTLLYGIYWIYDIQLSSNARWFDRALLLIGGYAAGTALTGAPFIVAALIQHVDKQQLRPTLFVIWVILVSLKMATFVVFDITIYWQEAILLLPIAAVGHYIGLKLHDRILQNTSLFKKVTGSVLVVISLISLIKGVL